ncbi:MAG: carboxylesterase/lipase family protein [Pseudomonadales bacterium]
MTTLSTRLGKLRGSNKDGANIYLGLRYGEPPTGKRRFLAPTMASSWQGAFDATQFPDRAVQVKKTESTLGLKANGGMSEDCLFLNVASPERDSALCPVLVWLHGGGFRNGSANEYDGTVLARQGEVVVVTVNSRLGPLGFLDLSRFGDAYEGSASNGFRDQILALQWVRDNIEDYGGDPNNVTLFGQSSGGSSVLGLLAAPAADGLFHKAIAHSATSAYKLSEDQTGRLAKKLKVAQDDCLARLLEMPAEDVVDLGLGAGVTVDGTVVTRSTYDAIAERGSSGVPLIAGSTLTEGTLYTRGKDEALEHYPSLNNLLATDMLCGKEPTPYIAALQRAYPKATAGKIHEMIWTDMFRRTSIKAAALSSAAGAGGWLYRFDLPANSAEWQGLGVPHAADMAFTFNTFANPDTYAYAFHDRNDPVVREVAEKWSSTIIQMARTGQPNDGGLPRWPIYDSSSRDCLVVDGKSRVESDPDRLHRELWAS